MDVDDDLVQLELRAEAGYDCLGQAAEVAGVESEPLDQAGPLGPDEVPHEAGAGGVGRYVGQRGEVVLSPHHRLVARYKPSTYPSLFNTQYKETTMLMR